MQNTPILSLTAGVVSAYVRNHSLGPLDLQSLIYDVFKTFHAIDQTGLLPSEPQPVVSIAKSVKPGAVICLECGAGLLMLKRHLKTAHNLTPDQYRARFKMPANHPLTAPNYSTRRSKIAKDLGLGTEKITRRQRKRAARSQVASARRSSRAP